MIRHGLQDLIDWEGKENHFLPHKDLVIGESSWFYALQVTQVPACVADGDTSLTNADGDLLTPSTE